MMFRPALLKVLCVSSVCAAAQAVAQEPAPEAARSGSQIAVRMEDFFGSTATAVSQIIKQDFESSGRVRITTDSAKWSITGSSSGGRLKGTLMDEKGEVVLSVHYGSEDLRTNAHEFVDDVIEMITEEPGIASRRIAYVRVRGSRRDIFTVDSSGEDARRVTFNNKGVAAPALSPGNAFLAYTAWDSGYADVWMADLRDGASARIISAPGTSSGAVFSPDGTRLALTMSHKGNPDIYITLAGGTESRRLTDSASVEFSPAWAPDSARLVFCSDATGAPQLYIINRTGGSPSRLSTGWPSCTDPDWCPDGQRIAFTGRRGGSRAVVIYNLASGSTTRVVAGADPSWAADGRHLAFVDDSGLHIIDTATGARRQIVSGSVAEPSWSR